MVIAEFSEDCYYFVSFVQVLSFFLVQPFQRFKNHRLLDADQHHYLEVLRIIDYFAFNWGMLLDLDSFTDWNLELREVAHLDIPIITSNTDCLIAITIGVHDPYSTVRCWIYADSFGHFPLDSKDFTS